MVPLGNRWQQRGAIDRQVGAALPAHARIHDPIRPCSAQGLSKRLGSRVTLGVVEFRVALSQASDVANLGVDLADELAHLDHVPKSTPNGRGVWYGDKPFGRSRSRFRLRNTR